MADAHHARTTAGGRSASSGARSNILLSSGFTRVSGKGREMTCRARIRPSGRGAGGPARSSRRGSARRPSSASAPGRRPICSSTNWRHTVVRSPRPWQVPNAARRACARHGIRVVDLNEVDSLPVYVDGADEIDASLAMIKGGGGALTREKIVAAVAATSSSASPTPASASRCWARFALPVEVIPMARAYVGRAAGRASAARRNCAPASSPTTATRSWTCTGCGSPIRWRSKRRSTSGPASSPWAFSRPRGADLPAAGHRPRACRSSGALTRGGARCSERLLAAAAAPASRRRVASPDPAARRTPARAARPRLPGPPAARAAGVRPGGAGVPFGGGGGRRGARRLLRGRVAPLDYQLLNDHLAEPSDDNLARWIRRAPGAGPAASTSACKARPTRASTSTRMARCRSGGATSSRRHTSCRACRAGPQVRPHARPRIRDRAACGASPAMARRCTRRVLDRLWTPLHRQLHHACLNDIAGLENPDQRAPGPAGCGSSCSRSCRRCAG